MNPADCCLNVGFKKICLTTITIYRDLLEAYDEVCGQEKNRKCNVNTWWCNKGQRMRYERKKKHVKKFYKIPLKKPPMITGDL